MAGFLRGWVDTVTMRVMDALFSFPPLVLALTVAALLGASINNAAIAIAIVIVPSFVRLIRGEVIAVREEAYVESAQSLGARPGRIMRTHVLPNVASPIIIQVALALGFALLAEAGLSFLGIGAQPPTPSWGDMLNEAYQFIFTAPLALVFPGLAIMLCVLSFNVVADGLRDAIGSGQHRGAAGRDAHPVAVPPVGQGDVVRGRTAPTTPAAASRPAVPATGWPRPPTGAARNRGHGHAGRRGAATCSMWTDSGGVRRSTEGPGRWWRTSPSRVDPGRTLGLVGESGSGKTVSALAMMGLLPPVARVTGGSVHFEAATCSSWPRRTSGRCGASRSP